MESGGEGWSARELTDFLAVLSAAPDAESAYRATAEYAAEAVGAEVAAVAQPGRLLAGVGLLAGGLSEAELLSVVGERNGHLDLTEVGQYAVLAEPIDALPEGWLIVARTADRPFGDDERLRMSGLSGVLSLSVRSLDGQADERLQRQEAERNAQLLASLHERQQLLERLSRIQRSIAARAPIEEVLDTIAKGAAELLGDEVVGLRRINQDRPGWVKLVAWAGIPPELVDSLREGRVGEGAGGRAVAEDRLIVIQNYADSPEALRQLEPAGLSSAMAAPVHENGQVVGSLVVASRLPGRRYSVAEQETLVAFADHASLAMTDAETVRALHRALDSATHDALHDQLTGLANRALLNDRLAQALHRSSRRKSGVAMLFLDLDGFKRVNDSLGHAAGDQLLVAVADRLTRCVRANDTTARVGGDEFAILLEDVNDQVEAEKAGDRILAALREPFTLLDQEVTIAASIGIASVEDVNDPDDILRNADLAMYEAKAAGKGQHRRFQPAMHVRSLARLELETALRRAVQDQQLEVHYQPIVELERGVIVGTEALVQWRHPERGLIPPAEFIPVAESTGLILPIGEWVLAEACRQTRRWQAGAADAAGLSVSVNVSGRQFQRAGLVERVIASLGRSGLAPSCLVVETTASVLMQDAEVTLRTVGRLQELGVRLAIDDFGTGEASLSCLRRFPIDIVKIDKSFIDGVAADSDESRLANAIINLTRTLRYQTVAEGVEYAEQAAILRACGCDLGQGNYFARPSFPEKVGELLGVPLLQAASQLAS